jgi:hypothetical protein
MMHPRQTQARAAGVLHIIATVAIIASGSFVGSTDSLEFLTEAAADENQVMIGTLLQLAWVLSVMFIPVVLYPVLKPHGEVGALGFFSLRFTEALLSLAYVVIQLTMLRLSTGSWTVPPTDLRTRRRARRSSKRGTGRSRWAPASRSTCPPSC